MALVLCYPKCTTCKKALKYLDDKGIAYTYRDISIDNPSFEELKFWHERSHLDIKRFFNTSGNSYRALDKEKLKDMSLEEKLELLSKDGMLVKRPILIDGDKVLVGFKIEEWEALYGQKA